MTVFGYYRYWSRLLVTWFFNLGSFPNTPDPADRKLANRLEPWKCEP